MKDLNQKRGIMRMTKGMLLLCVALMLMMASGCATFEIDTPREMIETDGTDSRNYVAMTHDGVVLRARVIPQGEGRNETPRGDQDFWVNALRERMRTTGGYALLEEKEVESANGHAGTRLEFGRDHQGAPYQYWMTLFVTDDNIHILDAGGRRARFESAQEAVESALASYEVLK
jgi:hypothetical protein